MRGAHATFLSAAVWCGRHGGGRIAGAGLWWSGENTHPASFPPLFGAGGLTQLAVVRRNVLAEQHHPALCGVVRARALVRRHQPLNGRDGDDAAGPLPHHGGQAALHGQEDPAQVDLVCVWLDTGSDVTSRQVVQARSPILLSRLSIHDSVGPPNGRYQHTSHYRHHMGTNGLRTPPQKRLRHTPRSNGAHDGDGGRGEGVDGEERVHPAQRGCCPHLHHVVPVRRRDLCCVITTGEGHTHTVHQHPRNIEPESERAGGGGHGLPCR